MSKRRGKVLLLNSTPYLPFVNRDNGGQHAGQGFRHTGQGPVIHRHIGGHSGSEGLF